MNKPLSDKELQEIVDNMNYEELHSFVDSDDSVLDEDYKQPASDDDDYSSENENINDAFTSEDEEFNDENETENEIPSNNLGIAFDWTRKLENFVPKRSIPQEKETVVLCNITKKSSEMDAVFKLFPKSLWIWIAQSTNQRLKILEKTSKKNIPKTTSGEIMIVLGCHLIMCYNRLPAYHMYWSSRKSLGNDEIKNAISRDRCQLLLSKLYFNNPEKPEDASKVYYIEEVLSCLKKTFLSARSDSTYQSIDETMTKFKGRTSMKQYVPLKPIKRGIKLWTRCDSKTGYVYDTNIYSGKENSIQEGTLGERVVKKLTESIRDADVVLCFDRFFTSIHLLDTLPYAAVGTCMRTRKNVPKFEGKLQRGDSEMMVCKEGILCTRWQDTKDFLIVSNCHTGNIGTIERKAKDGSKNKITCPDSIMFYNAYMGGVDHADQMISQYDSDRKSSKWWRKVFYKLFMTAIYNAFIIYKETRRSKMSFINFIITVAENMITIGKSQLGRKKIMKKGRPSNRTKFMDNVGDHLPIPGSSRKRCVRCATFKKEKRTKITCQMCGVGLCNDCFAIYHS